MSKFKDSNIQIWFLDFNLHKSAEYLTTPALDKTINGVVNALLCAIFYSSGIRNKKAYDYYFKGEKQQYIMETIFPDWPFKSKPGFKYFTSRTSKWVRQCKEHFIYIQDYLDILLDEYVYRQCREHKLYKFANWLSENNISDKIPAANIKNIILPWKSLKKKFRRKNIIEGYRLQFMDTFCYEDPIGAYGTSRRDVPEFVLNKFKFKINSMIT